MDGVADAIVKASADLQPATLALKQAELEGANINRSPTSYLLNPDAADYDADTDKNMLLLQVNRCCCRRRHRRCCTAAVAAAAVSSAAARATAGAQCRCCCNRRRCRHRRHRCQCSFCVCVCGRIFEGTKRAPLRGHVNRALCW